MSEIHLKQKVSRGRLVDDLKNLRGWYEVVIPKLKKELELAHTLVFDKRINDNTAKERIAYYNGLNRFFTIIEIIEKEKINSLRSLQDAGI